MPTIETEIGFRGGRNYLHGTDIYDTVLDAVAATGMGNPCGSVSLVLKKFAERQLDLSIFSQHEPCEPPISSAVVFRIGLSVGFAHGWLSVSNREVTTRFPYEEATIFNATRVVGRKAAITHDPGFSAIETAIAMTKRMHDVLFSVPGQRWIFSRLELVRPFGELDIADMTIEVVHNLADRMTKSLVVSRDERLGHIYFSPVPR